jgi:hypothetical protein
VLWRRSCAAHGLRVEEDGEQHSARLLGFGAEAVQQLWWRNDSGARASAVERSGVARGQNGGGVALRLRERGNLPAVG